MFLWRGRGLPGGSGHPVPIRRTVSISNFFLTPQNSGAQVDTYCTIPPPPLEATIITQEKSACAVCVHFDVYSMFADMFVEADDASVVFHSVFVFVSKLRGDRGVAARTTRWRRCIHIMSANSDTTRLVIRVRVSPPYYLARRGMLGIP